MSHVFFVMREPGKPDQVLVWDTRTVSIGRAPENDLTLDDEETSRKHALLMKEGARLEIGDYRTGNGTFVNGEAVRPKRVLQSGDVVTIGKLQMELHVTDEHPAKLGHKLAFASQLKTVGMMPSNVDAGATMLGMVEMAPADDFVVEPERGSGEQAFVGGESAQDAYQVRVLDDGFGELDSPADLELDLVDVSAPAAPGAPALDLVDAPGGDALDLGAGPDLDLVDPVAPAPPVPAPSRPAAPPAARPTAPVAGAASAPPAAAADPAGATGGDPMERMRRLKVLHEEGLITDAEFQAKRSEILAAM